MGRITKGILGGFSGRVGNVVGSRIFSIDVIRSYQPDVSNPQTESQVAQRTKFAFLVEYLRRILPILRIGWNNAATKMSAWNAAVSYNIHQAVTGTSPNYQMVYANMRIGQGPLVGVEGQLLSTPAGGGISLEWLDNSGEVGAESTDLFYGVVYNETKDNFAINTGDHDRVAGACLFEKDSWETGDVCYGWGFFITEDGSQISDSVYFGTGSIQA